MKFRKKPVVIEALLFDGSWPAAESFAAMIPEACASRTGGAEWMVDIPTLEGSMRAMPGDWIVQGVKGEFYPCKPDIFAATYEPAEETR